MPLAPKGRQAAAASASERRWQPALAAAQGCRYHLPNPVRAVRHLLVDALV